MAYKTYYNSPSIRGYLISTTILSHLISSTHASPLVDFRILAREPGVGVGTGTSSGIGISNGIDNDSGSIDNNQSLAINTGAIIGIAIGSFVAVIVVAIGAFFWRYRRSKRELREIESKQGQKLIPGTPNCLSSDVAPGHYHCPDNVRLVGEGGGVHPEMSQGSGKARPVDTQYNGSNLHP